MRLTVWGARGSIPVSGREFLKYGGDTTCLEVETKGGETVIFDCGTGIRALGCKLLAERKKTFHILLTHAHWDHVIGIPFFKPLFKKDVVIYFHGCTYVQESIQTIFKEALKPPFFPVDINGISAKIAFDILCPKVFEVADLVIESVPLSHPNKGFGFLVSEGASKFAFFPDNEPLFAHPGGRGPSYYVRKFKDIEVLFHDGEYKQREYERSYTGWGHSSYTDTLKMALEAGVGKLVFWHNNQGRPDQDVDVMLGDARRLAKKSGSSLSCDTARTGMRLSI
ncbi:MAG: MBL fold metallo-hydrolase [Elusimicrobia bacterium]|nr:MBL fold metallo-hydrolase [Elusimicrobiota bacterium]